ncbi:MAG: hypothetical protein HY059_20695 [Proteobacteria bacterium]|nr:hypothetical protein [Pseudomonadota bacterium]
MALTISSVAGDSAVSALAGANSSVKQAAAISSFNAANDAQAALVSLVSTISPPADSGRGQSIDVQA